MRILTRSPGFIDDPPEVVCAVDGVLATLHYDLHVEDSGVQRGLGSATHNESYRARWIGGTEDRDGLLSPQEVTDPRIAVHH